jgi:hypothetical protein
VTNGEWNLISEWIPAKRIMEMVLHLVSGQPTSNKCVRFWNRVSQNAVGLIVAFDTFNNSTGSSGMSKVHVAYGLVQNTTDTNNVEFFNTPGSSFHSPDLNTTLPFQEFQTCEVSGQIDPAAPANWIIKITIDGTVICNQSLLRPVLQQQ